MLSKNDDFSVIAWCVLLMIPGIDEAEKGVVQLSKVQQMRDSRLACTDGKDSVGCLVACSGWETEQDMYKRLWHTALGVLHSP